MKETTKEATKETPKETPQTRPGGPKPTPGEALGNAKDVGLKVVSAAGKVMSLASFIGNLLGFGPASTAPDQDHRVPQGGHTDVLEAMEEISERLKCGDALNASDIRSLPPETLMNIHAYGDDYVRAMVRDFEIEKEHEVAENWAEYDHERLSMGRER